MSDPVFNASDRVETPPADDGLPAELKGKSPAEIFKFMQGREQSLINDNQRLREAIETPRAPAAPTTPTEADITDADFYNKPATAASKLIDKQLNSKLEPIIAASVEPLAFAAKLQVKDKHKDFSRFETEIDNVMNKMTAQQRMQPGMWETVYVQVKGLKVDQLVAEAEARGRAPASEPVSPTPEAAPAVKELTNEQKTVAKGLGVTDEQFLKTIERQRSGQWPITLSNTGR